MKQAKVAMVGVGDISGIYLENISTRFTNLNLVGVYDLAREKAEAAKEKYSIAKIYNSLEELLADPEIDIVLNLTRPCEHYAISMAALQAGKHVYCEKPLASTLEEGRTLAETARQKGLLLGGAPDTFLGAGIQTCRKLVDDGFIGTPVGGAAFMICHGHEGWHPNPEFYYQKGGGPMMDMGPYYLTALVNLLGGVSKVSGFSKTSFPQRTIKSQPKHGQVIQVEVPTWVNGMLQFENGAAATIFTTFDVYYDSQARLEIYGSHGTLIVPDPNGFGGPVRLWRPEEKEWREMPLLFPYQENSRGLGLADMASALLSGGDFRASSEQTLHVLEIMTAIEESAKQEKNLSLASAFTRALPMGQDEL